ncbi:hypothetical protein ACQKOD_02760 [Bacillus mycoides]|uniref:hypothetical protein n=1 Tax=Bacillus mycoides TaxID=1405 RepID=UPI003D02BE40
MEIQYHREYKYCGGEYGGLIDEEELMEQLMEKACRRRSWVNRCNCRNRIKRHFKCR